MDPTHLIYDEDVDILIGQAPLQGTLSVPPHASGLVIFAHGSGSSRHSSRNRAVAEILQQSDLATLRFDLLTVDEEVVDRRTAHLRFDIPMLARRLVGTIDWSRSQVPVDDLPIGLFGASTGAAAALIAAAERPGLVQAVVSRGGRPDLAGEHLPRVRAPVLLLVGGADEPVIAMNEDAQAQLTCPSRLDIIPHADHLFTQPGTLDEVAQSAAEFFQLHLA
jgi:putative phosphoribosyl transferase